MFIQTHSLPKYNIYSNKKYYWIINIYIYMYVCIKLNKSHYKKLIKTSIQKITFLYI